MKGLGLRNCLSINKKQQQQQQTNQRPFTNIVGSLHWRQDFACGTGSNAWTASSEGAPGRGAAAAPRLEGLQK